MPSCAGWNLAHAAETLVGLEHLARLGELLVTLTEIAVDLAGQFRLASQRRPRLLEERNRLGPATIEQQQAPLEKVARRRRAAHPAHLLDRLCRFRHPRFPLFAGGSGGTGISPVGGQVQAFEVIQQQVGLVPQQAEQRQIDGHAPAALFVQFQALTEIGERLVAMRLRCFSLTSTEAAPSSRACASRRSRSAAASRVSTESGAALQRGLHVAGRFLERHLTTRCLARLRVLERDQGKVATITPAQSNTPRTRHRCFSPARRSPGPPGDNWP